MRSERRTKPFRSHESKSSCSRSVRRAISSKRTRRPKWREVVKAREHCEQTQLDYDGVSADNAKHQTRSASGKGRPVSTGGGQVPSLYRSFAVSHLAKQVCASCVETMLIGHLLTDAVPPTQQIETLGNAVRFFAGRMHSSARRSSSRSSTSCNVRERCPAQRRCGKRRRSTVQEGDFPVCTERSRLGPRRLGLPRGHSCTSSRLEWMTWPSKVRGRVSARRPMPIVRKL